MNWSWYLQETFSVFSSVNLEWHNFFSLKKNILNTTYRVSDFIYETRTEIFSAFVNWVVVTSFGKNITPLSNLVSFRDISVWETRCLQRPKRLCKSKSCQITGTFIAQKLKRLAFKKVKIELGPDSPFLIALHWTILWNPPFKRKRFHQNVVFKVFIVIAGKISFHLVYRCSIFI